MSTTTTIPVTIDPDAATLIAALGLEQPFGEMIEHARQAVPYLLRIEVEYGYKVEDPEEPNDHHLSDGRGASKPSGGPGHDLSDPERPQWDFVGFLRTYPEKSFARHFLLLWS